MFKSPLILFLDDGVNVYRNVEEAERGLEAWFLEEYPNGCGFDSEGRGFRFAVERVPRKVFWFNILNEGVKFAPDPELSIENVSEMIREQMIEYLAGVDGNQNDFVRRTNKELFEIVVKRSLESDSIV